MPGATGSPRPQTPSRARASRFGVRAVSSSDLPPGSSGSPPRPSATSRTIFEPFCSCSSRVNSCIFMKYSLATLIEASGRDAMQLPDERIEFRYETALAPPGDGWTPLAELQAQQLLAP